MAKICKKKLILTIKTIIKSTIFAKFRQFSLIGKKDLRLKKSLLVTNSQVFVPGMGTWYRCGVRVFSRGLGCPT